MLQSIPFPTHPVIAQCVGGNKGLPDRGPLPPHGASFSCPLVAGEEFHFKTERANVFVAALACSVFFPPPAIAQTPLRVSGQLVGGHVCTPAFGPSLARLLPGGRTGGLNRKPTGVGRELVPVVIIIFPVTKPLVFFKPSPETQGSSWERKAVCQAACKAKGVWDSLRTCC